MRRRLADNSGIALIMALGVLVVLSIATISVLTYSGSELRTVRYQKSRVTSYSLAEAGVNEAMSVLSLPANNALNTSLLPSRTSTYDGGTVTWSGSLNTQTSTWTVTSTGQVKNPTGAANVSKKLTVNVAVTPTLSQTLNNQAWNYIYAFKPNDGVSSTCEM